MIAEMIAEDMLKEALARLGDKQPIEDRYRDTFAAVLYALDAGYDAYVSTSGRGSCFFDASIEYPNGHCLEWSV